MAAPANTVDPRLMDRITLLLHLGEAISQWSHATDPNPWMRDTVSDEPQVLHDRIQTLTKQIQGQIEKDIPFSPLKKALGYGTRLPPHIQVVALAAFCEFSNTQAPETADSLAFKARNLFSEDHIRGMLEAKQVIGRLLRYNSLKLAETAIRLPGSLRYWMAGFNPGAQPRLKESDLERPSPLRSDPKGKRCNETLSRRIQAIPFLTPHEIFDELGRQGYLGQDAARRALSLAAYRHVLRLRSIHLEQVEAEQLPARDNCLLMGATGCGKSFLVKTLFEKILQLPTCLCDATSITEAGYVGQKVSILLQKLFESADNNLAWAQCGVSALDEIDKIASAEGRSAVFGASTHGHLQVSRVGVQRGLLKILEEDSAVDIMVAPQGARSAQQVSFRTGTVLFLACGAFTGLDTLSRPRKSLGFGAAEAPAAAPNPVESLARYGLSRELLGRFGSLIQLDTLSPTVLLEILEKNTIRRYARELDLAGIELCIEPEVKNLLVQQAIERGTGARSLSSGLAGVLSDACFSAYSSPLLVKRVRLYCESQSVCWELDCRKKVKNNGSSPGKQAACRGRTANI